MKKLTSTPPPEFRHSVPGVLAGVPASSIAKTANAIKTRLAGYILKASVRRNFLNYALLDDFRLQIVPKLGQTVYNRIIDCARKIYLEESLGAFCKGIGPRILRSALQFGITIFMYELLQR